MGLFPCVSASPERLSRHTATMAIRIGVQADSEDECAEALAQLIAKGYLPIMTPRYMSDGRWMARAVPVPTPAVEEPAAG